MVFLFDCEVLLLVELCLLPSLVVAIGEFGLHVLPHREGQVVDSVLGKVTALLRLHSPHLLLVVHPFVLQGILRHFVFPSELQDLISEAANRVFEVADFQLMVALDFIQNLESDGIMVNEGGYFVLQLVVLLAVLLEFCLQFLQDGDVAMLDLLLFDPLLIILPLQGLDLVLKFLNLVLVAAGNLKLGGEVIQLASGVLLRQLVLVVCCLSWSLRL